jgi:Uma2 family endonuclease
MAETDWHRDLMHVLIAILRWYYAADPMVYVSGNLLLFYERGNKRRHVSPDVFVVKGITKRQRLNYLLWREGKGPDFVIELTSSSTRKEDLQTKFELYQNVLRVREYFLFDPLGDYLEPPLQGYRLWRGRYGAIKPVAGRLPSKVLGLHLERAGEQLRLYHPGTGLWLPTSEEIAEQAEAARQQEAQARQQEAQARQQEAHARQQAEAEAARLRREVAELRRRLAREDR